MHYILSRAFTSSYWSGLNVFLITKYVLYSFYRASVKFKGDCKTVKLFAKHIKVRVVKCRFSQRIRQGYFG